MSLSTPTLHTARLRLRPFDDADAKELFAMHSSPYVLRYWDAPPWSEPERADRFISACQQMAEERSAALGYCFDDAAWGHGYATEAARAVLRWAFDTLDLVGLRAHKAGAAGVV